MAIVRRLEYMLQKPPVITFKRYPTSKRLLNTNLMRTVKQHPARFGRDLLNGISGVIPRSKHSGVTEAHHIIPIGLNARG